MKVNDPIRAESRGKIVYFRAAKCHETRFASTTSLLRDISSREVDYGWIQGMGANSRCALNLAVQLLRQRSFNSYHHISLSLSPLKRNFHRGFYTFGIFLLGFIYFEIII